MIMKLENSIERAKKVKKNIFRCEHRKWILLHSGNAYIGRLALDVSPF